MKEAMIPPKLIVLTKMKMRYTIEVVSAFPYLGSLMTKEANETERLKKDSRRKLCSSASNKN